MKHAGRREGTSSRVILSVCSKWTHDGGGAQLRHSLDHCFLFLLRSRELMRGCCPRGGVKIYHKYCSFFRVLPCIFSLATVVHVSSHSGLPDPSMRAEM